MNLLTLIDPRFLLAAIVTILATAGLGYGKGYKDRGAEEVKKQAQASEQARETEQEIRRFENRATAEYVAGVIRRERKAHELPKITIPADCTVPAAAGQLLNDAEQLSADAGSGPGAGAASPAVDSTCAAELEIAKRNYAEVCVPNAAQLTQLQMRWGEIQRRVNKQE